ncbi:hypothetical protein D3C87_1685120 [compost metagenome]
MCVDDLVLLVEADHMVGAGENHALDAMPARGFVDMEHAADVGAEDLFERAFYRHAAEVQDGVHAFDQSMHRLLVGKVAGDDFFAVIDGRGDVGNVRQANNLGIRPQRFAQHFAQATGGTGQQKAVERGCLSCSHGSPWTAIIIEVCCRLSYD